MLVAEQEKLAQKRKRESDASESSKRRMKSLLRAQEGATPEMLADNAFLRLVATCPLSFAVADKPALAEFVRAVQASSKDYKVCSARQVAGPVLKRCAEAAVALRDESLKCIQVEGATLCSDGMKKFHKNLTQNVLCVTRPPVTGANMVNRAGQCAWSPSCCRHSTALARASRAKTFVINSQC